jgi:glycosyltransferase involved in cell wall biosynthesis
MLSFVKKADMTIAIISVIRHSWGGSEELWYQMAKLALSKGYKVIHLSYKCHNKHFKKVELEQLGLISLYRPSYYKFNTGNLTRLFYLGLNFLRKKIRNPFKQLNKYKPDIIVYNASCYTIKDDPYLQKYFLTSTSKLIYIGHLVNDNVRQITDEDSNIILKTYLQASKLLFVSRKNLSTVERQLATFLPKATVIRNPVNIINPVQIPFPPLSTKGPLKMACVGNLITSHKGQDLLIQALSSAEWKSRKWQLHFYGEGPDEQYLKDLTLSYGLEKKVFFKGYARSVEDIWKECHVLVMASHQEGMPLAVVEAMLCGRPCVVPDIGGNEEWITSNVNGFLTTSSTTNAISQTLEQCWQNQSNLEEMGTLARKNALLLYDSNAGQTLLNIIETV